MLKFAGLLANKQRLDTNESLIDMINKLFCSTFILFLIAITGCKNSGTDSKESSNIKKDIISELTDKIAKDSSNTKLLFDRSKAYAEKSMYDLAFADMEKVMVLDSNKPEYLLQYADMSFRMNKVRASRDALQRVRALQPDNYDAAFRLAELYLYSNNQNISLQYLDTVLSKDPRSTKALLMRGFNQKEKGDTTGAIKTFRTAIDVDPKFYEAQMQLALISQAQNNNIAIEYYKNALALQPKSEEAMYGLGMWYQDHNDYNKAIETYTEIIKLNPKNKNAHFNLGYLCQIQLKVYDEAIKHYTNAIEADPGYAQAFYNRGLCFEYVGNIAAAKDDFAKALALRNNNYPVAQEGLDRVSK